VRLTPADQGDRREALFDAARAMLRIGVGAHAELEGVRRDGTRFPMQVSASRVRIGERALFVWVVREHTNAASNGASNGHAIELKRTSELWRRRIRRLQQ
jgi:hypothetical protein